MRTYRRRKARMETYRTHGGVKCSVITGKGVVCNRECKGSDLACKQHTKAHVRDNPTSKLTPSDTSDAKAVVKILNAMRTPEGMKLVNNAFVEMFVSREIFNPAENVNKFVTGGVAEDVIAELIPSVGFPTKNVAATETVIDIRVTVPDETGTDQTIGISLKNSGNINQQPILENYRGESKADIRDLPPTFIIYTETVLKRARIVYIDHAIIKQAYPDLTPEQFNATVYNKKADGDKQSSLSFKSGFLKNLIPRLPDEYIVTAEFPTTIPKVEKKSITLLALEYVRKAISEAPKGEVQEVTPESVDTAAVPSADTAAVSTAETTT